MKDKKFLKTLKKRHFKGAILKYGSMLAIFLSVAFLTIFLISIISNGYQAIYKAEIQIPITYSEASYKSPRKAVERKYSRLISRNVIRNIRSKQRNDKSLSKTEIKWVLADDQVDQYLKGKYNKLKSKQIKTLEILKSENRARLSFNIGFLFNGDSKLAEFAGVKSAIIGSLLTMFITMIISFPIGVMSAIYLEEFTSDSRLNRIIEVSINNLASVPSIIFGLLGLAVFINIFGMPRSSALVGGTTLALMTLPIIIVSSRAALRAVPSSIREAGYALGLSKVQIVRDHVLPVAMPSILTGSIIGLAQAIGETAPLIIIGMVAFIPDASYSVLEASTTLPAQIFTWAGMPERLYIEKTAAGIMLLLLVLFFLNSIAIYLRNKFQLKL